MLQGHKNIKDEMVIIEDNTLENIFPKENIGTIKEEYCEIYDQDTLHMENTNLNTCKRNQFSCLE